MRFLAFFVYTVFALAQANADNHAAEALARDSDLAEFTPRITGSGGGTGSALAVRQSCPPGNGICSGRWCCPFNSDCCRDSRWFISFLWPTILKLLRSFWMLPTRVSDAGRLIQIQIPNVRTL